MYRCCMIYRKKGLIDRISICDLLLKRDENGSFWKKSVTENDEK